MRRARVLSAGKQCPRFRGGIVLPALRNERTKEPSMIKVGVFYPLTAKFDWNYYLGKHTPMIQKLLAPALKKVDIEQGLGGGGPGAPATYTAICNLHFDSVEAFQQAFGPH